MSAVDAKPKSTTALKRLANLTQQPLMSLVVDHYDDDDWTQLWWVRVDGTASTVTTGTRHDVAVDALVAKYPQYQIDRPQGAAIIIEPTTWRHWAAS